MLGDLQKTPCFHFNSGCLAPFVGGDWVYCEVPLLQIRLANFASWRHLMLSSFLSCCTVYGGCQHEMKRRSANPRSEVHTTGHASSPPAVAPMPDYAVQKANNHSRVPPPLAAMLHHQYESHSAGYRFCVSVHIGKHCIYRVPRINIDRYPSV